MENKDIRKDLYLKRAKGTTAALHRLGVNFVKYRTNPICLVEGYDSEYYFLRVKMHCSNKEPLFINCGGKEGVIKTFEKIQNRIEYKEGKFMYFIDRDFDHSLQNQDIYETPCYAIENFYTSIDSVSRILRGLFKLEDKIIEDIIYLYEKLQSEFHDALLYYTAWMLIQRQYKEVGEESDIKVNLNNIKVTDLVKIDLDSVEKKYDLEYIHRKFPNSVKVDDFDIQNKYKEFSHYNPQVFYRGKYEIQFLTKFLDLLKENLGSKEVTKRKFGEKKNVALAFYDPISQFSQYADTPNSLLEYVSIRWKLEDNLVPV